VTRAASTTLGLRPGMPVWALVKTVSIRGHAFVAGSGWRLAVRQKTRFPITRLD
jgi:hypothetical protein